MPNFRNKLVKQMLAFALTFAMIVSSVTSSGMTVVASETPQSTEAEYTDTDTTDSIEEDVGIEEDETLEQDGAAEVENEDTVGSSGTGTGTVEGSKAEDPEIKSEPNKDDVQNSEPRSSEESSSAIQSSEEHSSAVQSSEEGSSAVQSSEEGSSEPHSSEPTGVTSGSGKIDVWDFGGVQQDGADMYENYITVAFWDDYADLATNGKFSVTSTEQFGDLTLAYNKDDRVYSASTIKKAGDMSAWCTYTYSDGYTANGSYYCNGTGGDSRRYLTIDNVSEGDRIDVYVGSSNTTETIFYFEHIGENGKGDGKQKDAGYAVEKLASDGKTKVFNTKLSFIAKYAGKYKIWADGSGGKPIFNRAARTHAANVEGTISLGPLAADANFTVKFVNETTKDETFAELDGTNFTAKLAPGYTYNAVLSGATGYGFSNASKKVTVTDEEAVKGKAFINLVVEEKTVYDYTGTIKGFAQDYDLSKLKVIMEADPDTESDDVELTINPDTLGFTAKLEPDVAYTITLEGVNDYKVKEGEETINNNAAYQADINVVLKDVYAVTGKFVDLEGNEVTGVTALKFKNDDDKYEYEATLAADKKSYTISLRDGAYSAIPTIENYTTTEHVVVEGAVVEKDILFVSTVADGALELKKDLYVGYEEKGDANYETVNKAVKAAKRMSPASEEQRITIHIAPGVYREQIIVDVPYVSFVNDTPEKAVKLTWYQGIGYQYYSSVSGWYSAQDAHDKYKKGEPKNWGAAVQIKSTGFLAEHIVFEHSLNRYITDEELEDGVEPTPAGGKPERNYNLDVSSKEATERGCALFIDTGGNNAEFYQCTFLSSQDTLGTGKKGAHAYFKECFIEGNTDYICYDGDTVFDNCVLNFKGYSDKGSGGYITAAQDTAQYGYLFRNCTITGNKEKGMIVDPGYLGRNWGEKAKVAFVNTKLESNDLIIGEGWKQMTGLLANAQFKEYNTTLLDGTPVDTSKRTAGTVQATNPAPSDVSVYFGGWTPKHYVEEEDTVAFTTKPFVTDNGDINTPYPGHTLIVGYSLGEANNANDASVIQWYRVTDKADATKDVLVKTSSATVDKTYKITKEDIGSYIKVVVTPTTVSGNVGEAEFCIVEEAVRDGYEDPDASGGDAELGDGINVFLIGDSTVKDYSANGMTTGGKARDEGAWGEFLQSYFDKEKITVVNYANGGRSSRSFINEGSLDKVAEKLSEGDYVFIQFGHNDCSNGKDYLPDRFVPLGEPDANGVFPVTPGQKVTTPAELSGKGYGDTCYTYDCGGTYKWYLQQYIEVAREKGAIPVLVTPVSRMYYTADGTIRTHHDSTDTTTGTYVSSNNAYVTAVKQLAQEQNVLLIDGFELTKNLFEEAYKAGGNDTYGRQIMHSGDSTHNNKLGGMIEAAVIATAIQNMGLDISSAVKAPAQVMGQTTTKKTVFSVDGKGKFTAYDILTDYAEKASYWEELGQKMFDAISVKAEELKPAEKPVASPVSGTEITRGQKITLTAEEGAEIRYTTDKTAPTKDSTPYDKANGILVSDDIITDNAVTIKAIAIIGSKTSAPATFTYTVGTGGNDDNNDNNNNDNDNSDDKIKADENEDVILLSDTSKITVTAANVFAVNKKASYKISVTYKNKKGELQELKENVHYNVRFVGDSDGQTLGEQKFYVEQVEDENKNPVKTDLGTFKGQSAIKSYTLLNKKDANKDYDISKMAKKLAYSSAVYTGTYITPGIEWKTEPVKDKDGNDQYKIVYRNNVNAGKASVTVLGQGDYYGSKTFTFTIKAAKLADIAAKHTVEEPAFKATGVKFGSVTKGSVPATTAEGTPFTYKGKPITFNGFAITYKNADCTTKLKNRIDYTIDYKKNAQEGTATATIKGMNNYTGSIKVTYAIENIDVSDLTQATVVAERALQGSGVTTIKIGDVTLQAGVDFKPDNKPLKEVTTIAEGDHVSVPIKGLGSYKKAFDKNAAVSVTKIENGKFHIKAGAVVDSTKLAKADTLKKKLSAIKITDVNGKTISDKNGVVGDIINITATGFTVTAAEGSGFDQTPIQCHVAAKLGSVAKQDKTAIIKEFDGVNTVTLTTKEIADRIGDKKGQNIGQVVTANQINIVSYKNNHKTGNATVTIQAKDDSPFYGTMNIKFKINPDRKTPTYGTEGEEGPETPGSSEGPEVPGSSEGPDVSGSGEGPEVPGSSEGPEVPGSSEGPEVPGSSEGPETPDSSEADPDPSEIRTVWMVGDSTMCAYDPDKELIKYYPRYGYGTQLQNYLDKYYNVQNLAMSGRSSKSFLTETNYTTLKNGIQPGDILIIGWGHNDQTVGEATYTAPNGTSTTEGSFAKSLYDNYVKLAQDKGAQPILCTPIVRRDDAGKYEGGKIHQANGGDYKQDIINLGEEVNVPVVDLTTLTRDLYMELGVDETIYLHAWSGEESNTKDNTHLNIYGAKKVAYMLAKAIKEDHSDLRLAGHIILGKEPTKEADLVVSDKYEKPTYSPPATTSTIWEKYGIFNGSVFGDTGKNPSKDLFTVGKNADGTMYLEARGNGKLSSGSNGIVMYYYQIPLGCEFTLSAKARIDKITDNITNPGQAGFGLMARDNMYVDVKNANIKGDYVVAGTLMDGSANCFYNEESKLQKGNFAATDTKPTPGVGEEYELRIRTTPNGFYACKFGNYEEQVGGFDFPLNKIDAQYQYIGMFVARNAGVTFSDIQLTINGKKIDIMTGNEITDEKPDEGSSEGSSEAASESASTENSETVESTSTESSETVESASTESSETVESAPTESSSTVESAPTEGASTEASSENISGETESQSAAPRTSITQWFKNVFGGWFN